MPKKQVAMELAKKIWNIKHSSKSWWIFLSGQALSIPWDYFPIPALALLPASFTTVLGDIGVLFIFSNFKQLTLDIFHEFLSKNTVILNKKLPKMTIVCSKYMCCYVLNERSQGQIWNMWRPSTLLHFYIDNERCNDGFVASRFSGYGLGLVRVLTVLLHEINFCMF